jgi:hypothetical protein
MKHESCFAVLVIWLVAVWPGALKAAPPQDPSTTYSQTLFAKGRDLVRQNRFGEAAAEFDAIALRHRGDEDPTKSYGLEALYLAGGCYARTDSWPQAKRCLGMVVAAGDHEGPIADGLPSGFLRRVIAYAGLSEIATREKDYKRAASLAEEGRKALAARLAAIEKRIATKSASKGDLRLQSWILSKKPFFDWKVAHPDQTETDYYRTRQPAPSRAVGTVPTSTTAQVRHP